MAISEKQFRSMIAAVIALILMGVIRAATGSFVIAILVALFIGAFDLWHVLIWMDGPKKR